VIALLAWAVNGIIRAFRRGDNGAQKLLDKKDEKDKLSYAACGADRVPMTTPGWWKRQSGYARTVVVLAVLLVLQFSLCAVLPSNGGFGGSAIQTILVLVTLALLIVVFVARLLKALFL
jgi:hypothetical protein